MWAFLKSEECKTFYELFSISLSLFHSTKRIHSFFSFVAHYKFMAKKNIRIYWPIKQHLKTTTNCLLDNIFTLRNAVAYLAHRQWSVVGWRHKLSPKSILFRFLLSFSREYRSIRDIYFISLVGFLQIELSSRLNGIFYGSFPSF